MNKSNENKGITLIALVITIILLLILGGVVVNQLSNRNIIGNAISVADKSKIASKKEEIQLAITRKMIEADGDITIEDIISKLEKNGIIDGGNSNSENGQVKTNPDGYVYEIVQDANGNWNVNYVGKGEIEATKITLATSVDTTSITNKVTITATAKAQSGIKSIQLPDRTNKTYASGTTTATATYEVTQNGTYKFTATNNNNESIDKTVAISNILEGEIAIAINPSTPTNKNVTATITWPSGNYSATKEVSTNGGTTYTAVTGTTTQINITANCNIRARIKTASGEIKTQTYDVTNIDKTTPTVTATESSLRIEKGESHEISGYFTITPNGITKITSTTYKDESGNEIQNTNTLEVGTHTITCTAIKETGARGSGTITIEIYSNRVANNVLEDLVDISLSSLYIDNIYKISKFENQEFFSSSAFSEDYFWDYLNTQGINSIFIISNPDANEETAFYDVKEKIDMMDYELEKDSKERAEAWQDVCEKLEYQVVRSNIYTFKVLDYNKADPNDEGRYEVILKLTEIWDGTIEAIVFHPEDRSIKFINPLGIDKDNLTIRIDL